MKLKTYRAKTMADALAAVKKDLGKDAVILHTRTYTVGGWFGWGGKPMVEVTASADVNALHPRQRRAMLAGEPAPAPDQVQLSGPVARAYSATSGERAQVVPAGAAQAAAPGRSQPRSPIAQAALTSVPKPDLRAPELDAQLAAELGAIKKMVGQVLQTSARAGAAAPSVAMPQALLKHYLRLIENEVARELADEIVSAIRDELTPAELGDDGIVRTAVLRRIETLLPVAEQIARPARDAQGRPLTLALIGPTGVGKTTTIAKLAAAYKLRHAKRVGLITTDTYRIAAVDQLRTYANIIGVPLKVVMSPEEMGPALESFQNCDVVLIDTAGRSPADGGRLDELAQFLGAASPHQTHLVLSGVCGEAAMQRVVERFGAIKPDHVIFTKLDEAASMGVLLNVARRIDAKLSYITTGQEVPDDIEGARADRLARLVLDGSLT